MLCIEYVDGSVRMTMPNKSDKSWLLVSKSILGLKNQNNLDASLEVANMIDVHLTDNYEPNVSQFGGYFHKSMTQDEFDLTVAIIREMRGPEINVFSK